MRGHKNLVIRSGAHATKVVFENARAIGVDYLQHGVMRKAMLSPGGEGLLSAGAIHSPQLLQLSGIGPHKLLQQYGIDTVAVSPGGGEVRKRGVSGKVGS